jgi:hypothetical protein
MQCAFFVNAHQTAVTSYIGGKDGYKPPFARAPAIKIALTDCDVRRSLWLGVAHVYRGNNIRQQLTAHLTECCHGHSAPLSIQAWASLPASS